MRLYLGVLAIGLALIVLSPVDVVAVIVAAMMVIFVIVAWVRSDLR